MKLKVKDMDIATGGPRIAILNEQDAHKYDLHAADRIKITRGNKTTIAIVDISENGQSLRSGWIGLFEEVLDALKVTKNESVHITIANKPASVRHIKKKLDGKALTQKETQDIIDDVVAGKLIQVELTYYVAANYINGMSLQETVDLTKAMINTGDRLHFKKRIVVDKHCIGGVAGNRTTMGVVPILAAAGLTCPKTSSRAITSPAGTADSMEVLTGVSFDTHQLKNIVNKHGACIVWGGAINLAPADDLIINVEHPLSIDAEGQLTASILAKKGSVGSTHVLIDIPTGIGSKIPSREKALRLKRLFEIIGKKIGMKTFVVLSDGRQPIGNGIGPALEARDVLWVLSNNTQQPKDLRKKCIAMAGYFLELTGKARKGQGEKMAADLLNSGAANKKMWEIIKRQGAKVKKIEDITFGSHTWTFKAPRRGKIRMIDNHLISKVARLAGCPKDKEAGLYLYKHVGDTVQKGDKLYTVYANSAERLSYARGLHKYVETFVIK
jgi:AMP phosphorylase